MTRVRMNPLQWLSRFLFLLVAGAISCPAFCRAADEEIDAIRQTLQRQADAWNRGDLEAFMEEYWQSAELTFSSGGATTRGWQAARDRYRAKYGDATTMGQLRFDELEIKLLGTGRDAALVLGRWYLARGDEKMEGNFTLVLTREGKRWQIIHDHTSLTPPAEPEPSP
jgi:uncharacterized protein (TIGR02246 family)